MDITLNELLDRALVVPYNDETVERLVEVCNSYLKDKDFSDDDVADLVIIVLTHGQKPEFTMKLEELYVEKYEDAFVIPRCVSETLAFYILLLAMDEEDISYNLALLNTMVIQNGQLERLPFAEILAPIIQRSLKAVDAEAEMEHVGGKEFLKKIFLEDNETSTDIGNDDIPIIRSLARDAWYYKTSEYIKGEQLKGLITYTKAYTALEYIVGSMPWVFKNERVMEQIGEIVPANTAKAKTVEEIIDMVRPYYNKEKDLKCRSSILLQIIADEKHPYGLLPFMKSKMTVREFAVWLYYELLIEKYYE